MLSKTSKYPSGSISRPKNISPMKIYGNTKVRNFKKPSPQKPRGNLLKHLKPRNCRKKTTDSNIQTDSYEIYQPAAADTKTVLSKLYDPKSLNKGKGQQDTFENEDFTEGPLKFKKLSLPVINK